MVLQIENNVQKFYNKLRSSNLYQNRIVKYFTSNMIYCGQKIKRLKFTKTTFCQS